MDIKKIKLVGILLLIIIFIVLILNQNKKETNNIPETDKITTIPKSEDKDLINIKWSINEIDLPIKTNIYKKKDQILNDELINKIVQSFGFNQEPAINNSSLTMYKEKDLKKTMDINKETKTIKYTVNLLLYPLEKSDKNFKIDTIKNDLNNLIKTNLEMDGVELLIKEIKYQEILGPRYVVTSKEEADIVEIKANYKVNNYPIFEPNGYPVVANYTKDGVLVKLLVNWFEGIENSDKVVEIKNFEEIKKTPLNQFSLISVEGDKNFDTSFEDEIIKEANITKADLGFFNSPDQNYLTPYIFLEGDSRLSTGKVVVILTTSVLK